MTARILVVDDEPDLEDLIQQKFRRQIRDGAVSFLFARDGVEALAVLEANRDVDMVVTDINMPRMDGLSLLAETAGERGEALHHHRLGLWRHGQHSHRDEPRRIRFPDQAHRFSGSSRRRSPRPFGMSRYCAKRGGGRRRPNARMLRSRATFRPTWPSGWPATRTQSISAANAARSRRCSPTLPASPPWWRRSNPTCLGRCSTTISQA